MNSKNNLEFFRWIPILINLYPVYAFNNIYLYIGIGSMKDSPLKFEDETDSSVGCTGS